MLRDGKATNVEGQVVTRSVGSELDLQEPPQNPFYAKERKESFSIQTFEDGSKEYFLDDRSNSWTDRGFTGRVLEKNGVLTMLEDKR